MASCGFAHLIVGGSRRSSADNPANAQCVVVGAVQQYSRPPSKFSLFGDSALDCESKNLPRATQMSANPPGCVTVEN